MKLIKIDNLDFYIFEGFFKFLRLRDELLYDINDPESISKLVKEKGINADILTFIQNIPDLEPKYKYKMEWDNLAAVPVTTYNEWLKNQIHRNARKRIKHVDKHAVEVKVQKLDENLAKGMLEIFNETPFRQGRRYPYYGISLEEVIKGWSTDLDRCDFLVAYHNDEVIGFIKLLYTKHFARASGTVTKLSHRDRAPMTFLLAKAVEVCAEKQIPNLIYGKFIYDKKGEGSLTEFKINTGFKRVDLPRYYIPLSFRGKIALALNLHKGIKGLLPVFVLKLLAKIRSIIYSLNISRPKNIYND